VWNYAKQFRTSVINANHLNLCTNYHILNRTNPPLIVNRLFIASTLSSPSSLLVSPHIARRKHKLLKPKQTSQNKSTLLPTHEKKGEIQSLGKQDKQGHRSIDARKQKEETTFKAEASQTKKKKKRRNTQLIAP
jgi:hypothetical protein